MANEAIDVFSKLDRSGGRDACWWWTGSVTNKGIPYFQYEGRRVQAYVLTYELAFGPLGEGMLPRHTCDNGPNIHGKRICCNPTHIIPGTHQDNMDDMKTRGRSAKTLYPGHVIAIREWRKFGLSQQAIADRLLTHYGVTVSREAVKSVLDGTNHEYVKEDSNGGSSSSDNGGSVPPTVQVS